MPMIKRYYCDNCNKEMPENKQFLIYCIEFWNKKVNNSQVKNFLGDNDCALMLCSKECIGEYISKLLEGVI